MRFIFMEMDYYWLTKEKNFVVLKWQYDPRWNQEDFKICKSQTKGYNFVFHMSQDCIKGEPV